MADGPQAHCTPEMHGHGTMRGWGLGLRARNFRGMFQNKVKVAGLLLDLERGVVIGDGGVGDEQQGVLRLDLPPRQTPSGPR